MNDLGWLAAAPHGWKSQDADQIVYAALKTLDFLGGMVELDIHVHSGSRRRWPLPPGPPFPNFTQELFRRSKERILLKNTPDDDHRMRPHDVNHRVPSKFAEMVGADQ